MTLGNIKGLKSHTSCAIHKQKAVWNEAKAVHMT